MCEFIGSTPSPKKHNVAIPKRPLNENNLTLDILKGKHKFSVRANVDSLKFFNSNFLVYVEKLMWCLNSIGTISKKQTEKFYKELATSVLH